MLHVMITGIRTAFGDPGVRGLLMLTFCMVASAAVIFQWVEGWSLIDSIYFSVVTISTVGFGDITPKTDLGKLFTIFYLICGIGVFVGLATRIADIVIRGAHLNKDE